MKTTKLNIGQIAVLATFAFLGIAVLVHTIQNGIVW